MSSVALDSALLCSVHGCAQVHTVTLVYIYIYMITVSYKGVFVFFAT